MWENKYALEFCALWAIRLLCMSKRITFIDFIEFILKFIYHQMMATREKRKHRKILCNTVTWNVWLFSNIDPETIERGIWNNRENTIWDRIVKSSFAMGSILEIHSESYFYGKQWAVITRGNSNNETILIFCQNHWRLGPSSRLSMKRNLLHTD